MPTAVTRSTVLNDAIRRAGWRRDSATGHLFDASGRDLGRQDWVGAWVALWRAGAIEPDAAMAVSLARLAEEVDRQAAQPTEAQG